MNDLTDEEFFGYPPFEPSGMGGVLHLEQPVWTRDPPRWVTQNVDGEFVVLPLLPNWPLFGWKTGFAPARPSPKAILDWLDTCLRPGGVLDQQAVFAERAKKKRELATTPQRRHFIEDCKHYVSDIRLLLKTYANDWPALRRINLPSKEFVSVDAANEVLRRVRERLTQDISPLPQTATRQGDGVKPPADEFKGLLAAVDKSDLSKMESKVVRLIAEKGGRVAVSDANTICGCDAKSAFKRAKPKLMKAGWLLREHHSDLCAEPLPKRGRK